MIFITGLSLCGIGSCNREAGSQNMYGALKVFHTPDVFFQFPGDNTGTGGFTYTKPTNIGLDLISTLVAIEEKHETPAVAQAHLVKVIEGLERLQTYRGIYPEYIQLKGDGPSAEVNEGRTRYSSIDSAWLHFGLSVTEAYCRPSDAALSARIKALLSKADYSSYVQEEGRSFRHGLTSILTAPNSPEIWSHQYDNINSEARVVLAFLVADGKVPLSIWENMFYRWNQVEGLTVAEGWHMNAFVEMSGNSYYDELELAPQTLGLSHKNYVKASQRLAENQELALYGWAPCFNEQDEYAEYGLDRTEVATPYAAALLTTIDDTRAWENFRKMLKFIPSHAPPRPYPDALDSETGKILNNRGLALDQNLLYHAIHKETVRKLVARTDWYAKAAELIKGIDQRFPPPAQEAKTEKKNP